MALTFTSKPDVSKAVAIFCGTVAVIFGYFGLFVASGAGQIVVLAISIAAVSAGVVAYTARVAVVIDREAGQISKRFSSVIGERLSAQPLSNFNAVTVQSGGRGALGEPTVVYFVALTGTSTLRITAASGDRTTAEADAKSIADYLELPIRD